MKDIGLQTKRSPAFTFTELVIVITVIGVLAALAFPTYRIQMLKMKNQEAVPILMSLWAEQREYYKEHGAYTTDIADLAIDVPTVKYFINPSLHDGSTETCVGAPQPYLAKMVSRNDSYKLYVLENGQIVCTLLDCHNSLCIKMGFEDTW